MVAGEQSVAPDASYVGKIRAAPLRFVLPQRDATIVERR
jgi:hypothetical protein